MKRRNKKFSKGAFFQIFSSNKFWIIRIKSRIVKERSWNRLFSLATLVRIWRFEDLIQRKTLKRACKEFSLERSKFSSRLVKAEFSYGAVLMYSCALSALWKGQFEEYCMLPIKLLLRHLLDSISAHKDLQE